MSDWTAALATAGVACTIGCRTPAKIGGPAGVNGQIVDEFMSTGAVVAGRGTFEPAGGWGGDHHDGVPIFILTRQDPTGFTQWPLVSYVNDVTTAMAQAKEAAGDRNVLVHGAGITQLALAADALDEIELHVIPVLFGQGRRLFDGLAAEQIELERTASSRGRTASPTCTTESSAEFNIPPRGIAGACGVRQGVLPGQGTGCADDGSIEVRRFSVHVKAVP